MDELTKKALQLLSIIPDGLELDRLVAIDPSWHEPVSHCIEITILFVHHDKIFFKHELYRRTIESSLSPFKRLELNKELLRLFLLTFEQKKEIERIVHYAKNANEHALVVKYAPLAASQAASVGAHIEASKLYLTAIEYAGGSDPDQLVKLYEAYAYECYLTNQVKEAIIYQGRALKVWQQKSDIEKTGNSLRFLSRLWWFDGNRDKGEQYGWQAIEMLQSQPASRAKAMAFSNMSQLKLFSHEIAACVEWGTKAIEMAKAIRDEEILCHALNNVGSAYWNVLSPEEGEGSALLQESLDIALKNGFHEHAARAYSNIISSYVLSKEYDQARKFLQDGLNYCEERDLDSSLSYQRYLKASVCLDTGDWMQAAPIAKDLLEGAELPGSVRMGTLMILSTIAIRTGASDALLYLEEARALAFATKEHLRIMPVVIALLEYEWLTGKTMITDEELKVCLHLVQEIDNVILNSAFGFWLWKVRKLEAGLPAKYEPYKLLEAGKVTMAARFWEKIACPFEQALALFEGKEEDKRKSLSLLEQLGAQAISQKVKMEMRASGIKKIPRGIRESTKTNPAQLTNRELDILQLLKRGIQNKEIAEALFISPKTVDHHISSILLKLDVNSRSRAVMEAVRLGILTP